MVVDEGLRHPRPEGLDLHHFYRAMAWLGGGEAKRRSRPRHVDLIEELFNRARIYPHEPLHRPHRTTTYSFYRSETLGEHSYSGSRDLKQMILGLVVDGDSICADVAGKTSRRDISFAVVEPLVETPSIGRVYVVADRGVISAATMAGLEDRKLAISSAAREPLRHHHAHDRARTTIFHDPFRRAQGRKNTTVRRTR